ncbi:ATP-binding protein [Peribacillus frigoritolerans]|uniref:ATP-binding protein n=1 Tax=Peribacillus castrilensis TaxID=2897690 RepID=UPI00398A94AC
MLAKLKEKQASREVSQEGYEKPVTCKKCQDMKVIIYRVHKDTKWFEDNEYSTLIPEDKVLESDFLLGHVCPPNKAWEWRTTYSSVCECVKRDRTNNLLKSSEITEEFSELGFRNFQTGGKPQAIVDAYDTAYEYFGKFNEIKNKRQNSIALLGEPGSGKTHLLTAVSNNLMRKFSFSVLYFPFVEGFDDLRDDFDALETKLNRMKKVDVLFIDDLFKPAAGKPRASEFTIEKMYSVINYRYLNKKPILISSELTVDNLVKVDPALGSRIYEMCEDYVVQIVGETMELNHRLKSLRGINKPK